MDNYIQKFPKVELHAHLNGSLQSNSILELGKSVFGVHTDAFKKLTQDLDKFALRDNDVTLDECFQKFKIVHELTASCAGLQTATELVIRDFQRDNVMYLELRTTPKRNEHMTKFEYLECVLCAMKKAKRIYPDINVKLIPSIDRGQSVAEAEETLEIVQELRHHWPQIVGIDLSGNPAHGKFGDFAGILQQSRESGLKLALHCGEIENSQEIAEMVEFGMERCGHGTFLNDSQLDVLHLKKAAIECCLSSNLKCRTVSSLEDHHFKRIFKSLTDVVLCTDDCGVFDTTLTKEYQLAVKAYDLDSLDVKRLVTTAIDHSFAEEHEKVDMYKQIENFCWHNSL